VAEYEKEVEEYVKKGTRCQLNKTLRPKRKAPVEITTKARHPFEKCAVDIVGPVTETVSVSKYILMFHDDLSKFVVSISIPLQDAETVAIEFVLNIVLKYGASVQIIADQGSNFLSSLLKSTCKQLKKRFK
jgi:hypothetical protein